MKPLEASQSNKNQRTQISQTLLWYHISIQEMHKTMHILIVNIMNHNSSTLHKKILRFQGLKEKSKPRICQRRKKRMASKKWYQLRQLGNVMMRDNKLKGRDWIFNYKRRFKLLQLLQMGSIVQMLQMINKITIWYHYKKVPRAKM